MQKCLEASQTLIPFSIPIYPISIPTSFFRITRLVEDSPFKQFNSIFSLITLLQQQKSPSFNKLYTPKRTEAELLILFPTMVMSFSRDTSRDKQLYSLTPHIPTTLNSD